MAQSREEHLRKMREYGRAHQAERTVYMREYRRRRIPELRTQIIDLLGGCCAQCGISDRRVLAIDHRFGGGVGHHRRSSTIQFLRDVLNDLDGFRILCFNCNYLAYHYPFSGPD